MAEQKITEAGCSIIYAEQGQKPPIANEEDVKGNDFTLDADSLPPGYFRSPSFLGTMLASGVSYSCAVGAFGFAAPILAYINNDIGPNANIYWVALAYLLSNSIGLIIAGRVTDIFGRRWFFIVGNFIGFIGSIVSATAKDVPSLIAGETLLGWAAAVQLSFAFIVGELVPTKWRFIAFGYIFAWAVPTSVFAAAISYAFVFETRVGWRGPFYILIALNALATTAWYFFYHPPSFEMKHGNGRKKQFTKEFDYAGTFMLVAGLLLLLMGLSWGGVLYAWNSAQVIATTISGFLLLIGFALYEIYVPLKEPILPMRLFRNHGWVVANLLWALGASIYYCLATLWPTMTVTLYGTGRSTMWIGLISCLPVCGIVFGELIASPFRRNTHHQVRVVFALGTIFLATMATCTPYSTVQACVQVFFAGTFIGWNEMICSTVLTIIIDDQREIGTATGIAGSTRSLISTISSAVYTAVLNNRLAQTIPSEVPPAVINAGLPEGSITAFIAALETQSDAAWASVYGLTSTIQEIGEAAYKQASSDAYKTVFLSSLGFCGIGVILTFYAPSVNNLLSSDVVVQLHGRVPEPVRKESSAGGTETA